MGDTLSNDVWSTINKTIDAVTNYQIAKVQTRSTPSGNSSSNSANPFAGMFSSHPQNDTKPAPGGTGFSFGLSNLGGVLVLGVVGLILFALFARR